MADLNQTVKYIVELDGKISPSFKKLEKSLEGVTKDVNELNKTFISPKVDPKATKGMKNFKNSLGGITDKLSGSIPMLGEFGAALTNPWVAAGAAIAATAVHLVSVANEINEVRNEVKKFTNDTKEVEETTNRFRALKKTLGEGFDVNEAVKFGNAVSKNWNIPLSEANKLIEDAEIATRSAFDAADISPDVLAKLKDAGVTAQEAFSIAGGAINEGLDVDKSLEAYGEFGIKIREMTKATSDALSESGFDPNQIQRDIESGAKTQRQVFNEIFSKEGLTKKQRQTLIADVAGTPAEDIGERGIQFLVKQNELIGDQASKQKDLQKINSKNNQLTEAQSRASSGLIPIIKKVEEIWTDIQIAFYDIVAPIVDLGIEIGKLVGDLFDMSGQSEILGLIWQGIVLQFKMAVENIKRVVTVVRAVIRFMKELKDKVLDSIQQTIVDIFGEERIERWKKAFVEAINFIKKLWEDFSKSISDFFEKLGNYADGKGFKLSESSNPGSEGGSSNVGSFKSTGGSGSGADLGATNQNLMDNTVGSTTQAEVKTINVTIDKLQEIGVQNITGDEEQFRAQLQAALQAIIEDTSQL